MRVREDDEEPRGHCSVCGLRMALDNGLVPKHWPAETHWKTPDCAGSGKLPQKEAPEAGKRKKAA